MFLSWDDSRDDAAIHDFLELERRASEFRLFGTGQSARRRCAAPRRSTRSDAKQLDDQNQLDDQVQSGRRSLHHRRATRRLARRDCRFFHGSARSATARRVELPVVVRVEWNSRRGLACRPITIDHGRTPTDHDTQSKGPGHSPRPISSRTDRLPPVAEARVMHAEVDSRGARRNGRGHDGSNRSDRDDGFVRNAGGS
jgi:hypothetical protein